MAVVAWNDCDPHQEECKCHGDTINQTWFGKFVVAQHVKKPTERHQK